LGRLLRSGFFTVLCYGVAAAVACGLQLVPYLGWIVLAAGGPLWMGFLVHLMMLHLAGVGILGMISRAWLVLPLAYYGGGLVLHSVSLGRAHVEAEAIEQAAQRATFKVDQPFSFLNAASGGFELLKHYRIDRAFLRQGHGRITTQYFARGEACNDAIKNRQDAMRNRASKPLDQPSLVIDLFGGYHDSDKTRQCILSRNDLPASWRYRIESQYLAESEGDFINARFGSRYSVIDEITSATLLTVETGAIGTLPPIQTITAICSLYSGSLKCRVGLLPSLTLVPIGHKLPPSGIPHFVELEDPDTWEIGILARALSLQPRTRAD
jgi:hypothetical protein